MLADAVEGIIPLKGIMPETVDMAESLQEQAP
jgi:hypothetical protein